MVDKIWGISKKLQAKACAIGFVCAVVAVMYPTQGRSADLDSPIVARNTMVFAQRVTPTVSVEFELYLPLRSRTDLENLIHRQSDPHSPDFRHFLSNDQFKQTYGTPAVTMARADAILQAVGLEIVGHRSQSVRVRGRASDIGHLFNTDLLVATYGDGHTKLASASRTSLPAELQALGAQVYEFSTMIRHRVHVTKTKLSKPANRTGPTGSYWYDDLKEAYDFPSYLTLTGVGRTIGIVIASDVLNSDITSYFSHEGLTAPTLVRRPINGGAPFAATGPTASDSQEATLDVEQAGGAAPGSTIVLYNIPDLSDGSILAGYSAVIDDNVVDIVNSSFGGCEALYSAAYNAGVDNTYILYTFDSLFMEGNAKGITFVASSGDSSSLACPPVAYFTQAPVVPAKSVGNFVAGVENPASSPHVTAVGGTNLTTSFAPPALTSTYVSENAYYDNVGPYDPFGVGNLVSGGLWGSGGGHSIYFAAPAYQAQARTGSTYRTVPDISLHMGGCPSSVVGSCSPGRSGDIAIFNGTQIGLIGTSAAAPAFAGVLALKEQFLGGVRLGNENPDIYTLAASNTSNGIYRQLIPNKTYPTQTGYNQVLGNGTPDVKAFIGATASPSAGDPQSASNP